MIKTIWQPSYTPVYQVRTIDKSVKRKSVTKEDVLQYLETNGITTTMQMMKDFGITNSSLRHSLGKLKKDGLVDFERSGKADGRISSYWALSNPPKPSQRCLSYRLVEWFRHNPWAAVKDIPNNFYTEVREIHSMCITLEDAGKLVSRKITGNPKEDLVTA